MSIKKSNTIKSYEITSESIYLERRKLIKSMSVASAMLPWGITLSQSTKDDSYIPTYKRNSIYSTLEPKNSFEDITTYNNFYEFGMGKSDPYQNSANFEPAPWNVKISGEANKTGIYNIDDLIDSNALEERVYRLRCVEAWSMVIPWIGIPLGNIIKKLEPNSKAKYVAFETVYRPSEMPGQRKRILNWPYVEALTMAEAMNPLTLIAVGLYGQDLLNQSGAPMRLVVPWKYGFKSIKSINKIHFQESQPKTSWNISASNEYGFYANVNPQVDHPRWSQSRERRIGNGFFGAKQPTLMFNGYQDEVAHLYQGMNLRKYF
ncbi:protein-methionine-sulfoxide reductase catalytic subunit MsrP [Gammaproteobacteria bacterium]|nr:protein-methionine-sulfoxide reductase catalytic subunit MsrP [Gammaproteobacteria bacterium]